MPCDCQARLRVDAEQLLTHADKVRRRYPRNADVAQNQAMSLALAIGHLRRQEQPVTDALVTLSPCPKPSCKLDAGHAGVCRDRWTKPLVKPPGSSRPVAYYRATKFVDVVEDRYNLERWQMRHVALGLAISPDLLLKVGAADLDDRDTLNDLCQQALNEAKANDKRDRGTLLHALTEIVDAGGTLPDDTSEADRSAVMAYVNATKGFRWLHREQMTVVDHLKVAGTPDGIAEVDVPDPDGVIANRITDLKSGNMDFGQLKTAGQLALYSRAQLLNTETWERTPLPEVNQRWGVVLDMDAEQGTVLLRWIDLTLGWAVVEEAARIRALRGQARTAFRPFPEPVIDLAGGDLLGFIAACNTREELEAMFHRFEFIWTEAHTAAAKARIDSLAASAA